MSKIITCSECSRIIDQTREEYCVGDVSGDIYCVECSDHHVAVTMVRPDERSN